MPAGAWWRRSRACHVSGCRGPAGPPVTEETTLRTDPSRRPWKAAAFVLVLTVLAGCALNKGSALAAGFEQEWAGTPDVAEIDAKGSNSLPFLGTASGTLVVAEGTPADRVTELAADLRRYVADHDGVEGRIEADGVAFTVVAGKARTDEVVALWRSLTADTRVRRADIDDTAGNSDRWRIDVDTADATEAMAVFRDLLSGGGRHEPLSAATFLGVGTWLDARPSLHVETGGDGRTPGEAIAAYEAVRARYAIIEARLKPDRATISLAPGADLDGAAALASAAAPSLGANLEITSGRG
ncbi:hypothetical protein CS0771_64110 [Catellatospora sp. IY07-71]|uniref:hypothetical protein n=1 Tax=Catellatospora sp. IY07-71 TaxID=2728827 RepID=UPI001BB396AB|nr:hypothetical protein [Catellatospora sp. IY07-71]BCJ76867.1 hypothetical protein CS0771_64110 [Catellatospora sp. IY07-71]